MATVSLKDIKKNYGSVQVVHKMSLDIADHEFVVLVGPSGCGKSTTLRMVAGLEDITGGDLYISGNRMNEVSPSDRGVSMVFQDYALYPHMTVYENLAFSLRLKKTPKAEIEKRVMEAATMLDLGPYLQRKPAALSGGQRQRVAMGRAIVKRAQVFLYDEPLSNLDAKLRSKMRTEIKRFHMKSRTTSIYVTHDQLEAMTLADRLVVMKDGNIQQVGTPLDVFGTPNNVFVATFIGSPGMNLFKATLKTIGHDTFCVESTGGFNFKLPESRKNLGKDLQDVVMGIRPSDIFISTDNDNIDDNWKVDCEVVMVELLGKNAYVTMKLGDTEFLSEIMGRAVPAVGDKVKLSFNLNHSHLFDEKSEQNLLN